MPVPSLDDVVRALHEWYPPQTADDWDAVGLVYGDPAAPVKKVLFAVDPSPSVAEEAAEWGADLLVVHHPLFLKPVHGFAATTPKGRTLATLARAGCALLTAHTNADQAEAGVSEALATALGLTDQSPIRAAAAPGHRQAHRLRAGRCGGARPSGDRRGRSRTDRQLRLRLLQRARSGAGSGRSTAPTRRSAPSGSVEIVEEVRVEVVLDRALRAAVVGAMLAAHPYEEPAFDLVELADHRRHPRTGSGRIGSVERTTLAAFADPVAAALPETAQGVRFAGDPDRVVRRVAVCGGAGDFLLDAVRATDADVYVTSDLRHHPAGEFLEHGRTRAGRRRALGGGVDLAARGRRAPTGGVRRGARRYGGDPRERDQHRPLDRPSDPHPERRCVKADPFAQLKLLDVQSLDAKADLLRHQRASLPELAEIATLSATRAEVADQIRDQQIVVDDLTATQQKADADVEQVKARRTRDRDRMDQGLISNPKDLERMQHELETLERRISDARGRGARGHGAARGCPAACSTA